MLTEPTDLIRRLGARHPSLWSRPVVALVAPMGYDKSKTLAAIALRERTIGLTLSEADRSVRHLVDRLHRAAAAAGLPLPFALGSEAAPDLAEAFAIALRQHVTAGLTLVLDQVDRLLPTCETARFLQDLVPVLPPATRLVVAGRNLKALPTARWRATSLLEVVGPEALAWSRQEVQAALADSTSGLDPARLHEQTGGWPAAIRLILATAQENGATGAVDRAVQPGGALYAYLTGEMELSLPAEVIAGLCTLAVLPRWDHAALSALQADPDWIERARDAGLPIGGSELAEPHPLLRQVLLHRLRKEPGSEGWRAGLARIVRPFLLEPSKFGTWQAVAAWLPAEATAPEVLVLRSWLLWEQGLLPEAIRAAEEAALGFRQAGDPTGEALASFWRLRAELRRSPGAHMEPQFRAVLSLLGEAEPELRCRLHLMLGQALRREPDRWEAEARTALAIAHQLRHEELAYMALTSLSDLYFERGELKAAIAHAERAVERLPEVDIRRLNGWLNLAFYLQHDGRREEAMATVRACIRLADSAGGLLHRLDARYTAGAVANDCEDFEQAERFWQEARVLAVEADARRRVAAIDLSLGALYHQTHRYQKARDAFASSAALHREGAAPRLATALAHQAMVTYHLGDQAAALVLANEALAVKPPAMRDLLAVPVAHALVRRATPEYPAALAQLVTELDDATVQRFRGMEELHLLLLDASAAGIDPGRVSRWLTYCDTPVAATAAATVQAGILGPLSVVVKGSETAPQWRRPKVRELLLYLLIKGFHPVSSEVVLEALWPDMDAATGRQTLRTTLHRLRSHFRAAGAEPPFTYENGCFQLAPHLALDMQAFLELVSEGDQRWAKEERQQAVILYQRAAALWRGAPLADDPEIGWADLEREHLNSRMRNMLSRLARHELAQGNQTEARRWAERLIELDPCAETGYRVFMRLEAMEGRRHEALRWFDLCRERLREELGVEPTPSTVRLAVRLERDGRLE